MDRLKILSALVAVLVLSFGCQVGNYHPGEPAIVPALGTLSGIVRSASGAAVPGAWVWDGRRKTVSSASGEFRLYNVEPGPVVLSAHSGEAGTTLEVCASAGQEMTASLTLADGAIHGIVRSSATGRPIQGAQVTMTNSGKVFTTYEDGRFFFVTPSKGTHAVKAYREGFGAVTSGVLSPEAGFSYANIDLDPK